MLRRSRLLCPCRRAELILDTTDYAIYAVLFISLFDDIDRSSPLLRDMWHSKGAGRLSRGVPLNT